MSSTSITATTPPGTAGAVNVTVTNSNGQSGTLSGGFTYTTTTPSPTFTGVTPNSGPATGGTAVTIPGTNFASVTVTFSQPATYADVRVLEYSGVTTLDATSGAFGNGASASSGAVTITSSNELILGANTLSTKTTGAGPGFVTRSPAPTVILPRIWSLPLWVVTARQPR